MINHDLFMSHQEQSRGQIRVRIAISTDIKLGSTK